MIEVSIVLPAFNEAQNLEEVVNECVEVFSSLPARFEIIIVDDGSSDGTSRIADKLASADPRIKALHHSQNLGYGAALRSGFVKADMEYIFFTDTDKQFRIHEIKKLTPLLDRAEMVIGYRKKRQVPLHRRVYGRVFSALVRLLFGVEAKDVNCAFKIFKKSILQDHDLTSQGALVNAELLAIARLQGVEPMQVPVTHCKREAGSQSGGSPRVIRKAVTELIRLKARYPFA